MVASATFFEAIDRHRTRLRFSALAGTTYQVTSGANLRKVILATLTGYLLGLAVFLTCYVVNSVSLSKPPLELSERLREAFQARELDESDHKPGDTRVGHHQFNDCLILAMALDSRASDAELSVSPSHAFPNLNTGMCRNLKSVVFSGFDSRPIVFYHNYIHGQTALARILIPYWGVKGLRDLYKNIVLCLVGLGLIGGLAQLVAGRAQGAFWTVFFIIISRWFGIESFGQSLGHGPSDIAFLSFAVFLTFGSANGGLSVRALTIASGIFGGMTILFELLTGGIPLGLALLIGGLPFAMREGGSKSSVVLRCLLAYGAAIAACMSVKLVLVARTFGLSALLEIGSEGLQRVGGVPKSEVALDLNIQTWLSQISGNMVSLAPGMGFIPVLLVEVAFIAGFWGVLAAKRISRNHLYEYTIWLSLSNLPIVLWLALFAQHTIVHAWFMDRMFAWSIASALVIFGMGVVAKHRERWDSHQTDIHVKS